MAPGRGRVGAALVVGGKPSQPRGLADCEERLLILDASSGSGFLVPGGTSPRTRQSLNSATRAARGWGRAAACIERLACR